MELSMQTTPLTFLRCVYHSIQTQEETAEPIVPDSEPDIDAVADCTANLILREKDLRQGSAIISGKVMGTILYLPEDGTHPRNLRCELPFSIRLEDPALTENTVLAADLRVKSLDARVVNSRKAMLRVNISVGVRGYEAVEEALAMPQADCPGLEVRAATTEVLLPLEMGERAYAIRDTLMLPGGYPAVAQVYRCRCTPLIQEQKLVGRKAVFKGTLQCRVLYLGEDQALHRFAQEVPFSQYLELEKEYDQEQVEILPLLTALSLEQEGEGDGLFLTASLLAQCLVRGTCTVQTIVDAYTTQGIFEPEWKTIPLAGCLDRQSGMQTLRQVIAEPMGEIVDAEAYPDFPAQRREGEQVTVVAPVLCRVLGYDNNGVLHAYSCRAEGQQSFALSGDAVCLPRAELVQEPEATATAGGTEVRCQVKLDTAFYAGQDLRCLAGGTVEEEPRRERPSVILRSVLAGAELWELAKGCRASVDAIRAANHMEGDVVPQDALVLIPLGTE